MTAPLLELCSVTVRFGTGTEALLAVDRVDLSVGPGETVALVGESGSGKTTLARVAVGLHPPTEGSVRFAGEALAAASPRQRGRQLAMIFQDPKSSLNPRLTIAAVLRDPYVVHRVDSRAGRDRRVRDLLDAVGLPESVLRRRVRELSGGQLQRVAIARALALEPRLIVADEPTSALDVSLQAQIVALLAALRADHEFALVVVSHDLRVVHAIADRVVVMKSGRVVEASATVELFATPAHPYTRELLAAVPRLGDRGAMPVATGTAGVPPRNG